MEYNINYNNAGRSRTIYDPAARYFQRQPANRFSSLYGRATNTQNRGVNQQWLQAPSSKIKEPNTWFKNVVLVLLIVGIVLAICGFGGWLAYYLTSDGKSANNTGDTTVSMVSTSTEVMGQAEETTSTMQDTTTTTVQEDTTTEDTTTTEREMVDTTQEVNVTSSVEETTTEQMSTTQAPAIALQTDNSFAATTSSLTIEINDPFGDLDDDDDVRYYLFVATLDNVTLLDENNTWASVYDAEPPFAYVTMVCRRFSEDSGCETVSRRRKREADVKERVLIDIGTNFCDPEEPKVVCNGELRPRTEYFFLIRRNAGQYHNDTAFSESIQTKPLGLWDEWASWSDCDVTCGGGLRRRSRVCAQHPPCQGVSTESERCSINACVFEPTAGTWLSWSAWSDCTYTCGGGEKLRTRMCDEGPKGKACVGDSRQIVECGTSACPDCSVQCISGFLNTDCTHCECYTTFTGIVKSTDNAPLSNVALSMSDKPYHVLTTTSINGQFTLVKLCLNQEILFSKTGYSPLQLNAGSLPNVVQLEGQEPLMMDLNPRSKKRIIGDDVLFCCAAIGNPPPELYEWFKNGMQLAGESGSTLSLTDLSLESAGSYRCRANTESTAIYSAEAILTVKASPDDFCPDTAEVKNQALPYGCLHEGSSVINVGTCAKHRCRGDSVDHETCSDTETFCCAASKYKKIKIPCDGFTFSVYQTVACGCARCVDPVVEIQGFVFSALDRSPLEGVDIFYNKSQVSRTARNGQFYFSVPEGTLRVSITAQPPNASEYADGVSVVSLSEDADGVFYTIIKLAKVTVMPPIDSSLGQELSLTTNDSNKELLTLAIPPNSFYDEDGNQIEGLVTPYVSTIDATNIDDLESAPGDFTVTDDEGDVALLKTFGMFQLGFKTISGSDAHLTGDVDIDIPETLFGTVTPEEEPDSRNSLSKIKLYILPKTSGVWTEASSISEDGGFRKRRKRSQTTYTATVAGITLGKYWYNFDAVSDTTCYSKVRVFENEKFEESEQRTSVTVFAMVKDDLNTHSYSTRLANGNNNANGYCIVHRCDKPGNSGNGFQGYLVVQKNGKYLLPAISNTTLGDDLESKLGYEAESNRLALKFDMMIASDGIPGPFYDWNGKWWDSESCINADFSDRHFQFHLHPEEQCDILSAKEFEKKANGTCNPEYYMSWYSIAEENNGMFLSCYARVKIAHYTNRIRVQATSKVGTMMYSDNQEIIKPGDVYGTHEDCVKGGVVCVRIKPSGPNSCSTNPYDILTDNHTQVDITARYQYSGTYLNVSEVNTILLEEEEITVLRQDTTFSFISEYSGSAEDFGIFCSETKNKLKEVSRREAEEKCLNAKDRQFAVQFGVGAQLRLLFVLDTSGTASSSSNHAKSFMMELVSYFSIGFENTQVALVTSENPTCHDSLQENSKAAKLEWDFLGNQTSSFEALELAINSLVYKGGHCDLHPSTYTFVSENVLVGPDDGTPTVVVSITDGEHDRVSETLEATVDLVGDKTQIMIAVGVGGYLSEIVYMNMLATAPEHVYSASQVSDVVDAINEAI